MVAPVVTNNMHEIFSRGYMQNGEVLDPDALRPYVNQKGISVVSVFAGYRDVVQNGVHETQPVYMEKQVYMNALLRKGDWEAIDKEVQDIYRTPLVGIDDLRSYGLVKSINDIGVSVTTYEQASDLSPADVSMTLTPKKGDEDLTSFEPVSTPIPITSKPFSIDLRTLSASRRNGHEGLDVSTARTATIKVREALEDMLFLGSSVQMGSLPIYGYTTHPNRLANTAGGFGGGDFGTDTNGHKTLVGMIDSLAALGFPGPFGAYVANAQYRELLTLTGDNKNETQLSVILKTIPELKFVRRGTRLTAGQVVVNQLTKDVVNLVVGQDVTPISWQEFGGLKNDFRIMAAIVPEIRFDANGNCGVAHATGA
jgi:Uncharacterized protein, linocin/CFP29 homolog